MASKPKSLRVFLCHSSGDKPIVRDLYKRLAAEDGIDPWFDEENLLPGQGWREEIPKAVRASDVVIVCLSSQSITKRGYVQKEIKIILDVADEQLEGTIFLIPVKLDECKIPDRLSHWQYVNHFEERGYERLMRALRECASTLVEERLEMGTSSQSSKGGEVKPEQEEREVQENLAGSIIGQDKCDTPSQGEKLFIIYTDEVESTERRIQASTDNIIDWTSEHFAAVAVALLESSLGEARIIKNVGDSLVIRLKAINVPALLSSLLRNRPDNVRIGIHAASTTNLVHEEAQIRQLEYKIVEALKEKFSRQADRETDGKRKKEIMDQAASAKDLVQSVWVGFPEHLKYDVFGHEMNVAARVSSIPKSSMLIVSHAVLEAYVESLGNTGAMQAFHEVLGGNLWEVINRIWSEKGESVRLSRPFPIVSLKGLDRVVSMRNPQYIYEAILASAVHKSKLDRESKSLYVLHTIIALNPGLKIRDYLEKRRLYIETTLCAPRAKSIWPDPFRTFTDLFFSVLGYVEFKFPRGSEKHSDIVVRSLMESLKPCGVFNQDRLVEMFLAFSGVPNPESEIALRNYLNQWEPEALSAEGRHLAVRTELCWGLPIFQQGVIRLIENGERSFQDEIREPNQFVEEVMLPEEFAAEIDTIWMAKVGKRKILRTQGIPCILAKFKLQPPKLQVGSDPKNLHSEIEVAQDHPGKLLPVAYGSLRGYWDAFVLYYASPVETEYTVETLLQEFVNYQDSRYPFYGDVVGSMGIYFLVPIVWDAWTKRNLEILIRLSSTTKE